MRSIIIELVLAVSIACVVSIVSTLVYSYRRVMNSIADGSEKSALQLALAELEIGWPSLPMTFLNASLLSALISGRSRARSGAGVIDASTVAGVLVGNKMKSYAKSYLCLLVAWLLAMIIWLSNLAEELQVSLVFLVLAFVSVSVYLNQWSLSFRIRKNLYGTTSAEAREILAFIIKQSDKSDFFDDDGNPKRLVPKFDLDEGSAHVDSFTGRPA